jgi:signal peptidase II
MKNMICFFASVIVLVFLDQMTKIAAVHSLKGKSAFSIIPDVFEFSYLENTGSAWGMMEGARIFFLILTVAVFIFIVYVIYKMPETKKYIPFKIMLYLLGAGAIGNFIDRLFLGYVRDFIYFKLINFPIFNVADCYVTIAMILFAVLILFVYKENDFSFIKGNNKNDAK